MSDALLHQGWDNNEPTPIYWETVQAIFDLDVTPKKPKQPRNKDGRYAKND